MPTLFSIDSLTPDQIATICDHTFLNRSEAYRSSAAQGQSPVRLRAEAFEAFLKGTLANRSRIPYAVCVRPEDVYSVKYFLRRNKCYNQVAIASVVGFPDGSLYDAGFKLAETKLAISRGAREIDMVMNYALLKAGNISYVREEVSIVAKFAQDHSALVKLILETSELTPDQIKKACEIADKSGVDFVKTSTGFSAYGARAEDLAIMREYFPRGIKISGGVCPENVRELLKAASGREEGCIELNPFHIRIGESSLLARL